MKLDEVRIGGYYKVPGGPAKLLLVRALHHDADGSVCCRVDAPGDEKDRWVVNCNPAEMLELTD